MERRLTAILAADVVGYSRLMTIDEAGTLAALTSLRKNLVNPKISEHNGRIVKLTGDGMLIEFPSVVSAVACAVDIQSAMRTRNATEPAARIEFRIGVNLGDIIVEDGDIFGDGVNVAARLESIAPIGGIAVSQSVRDHVGKRLDLAFEDMGERRLKNIEAPIRVYSISVEHASTDGAASAGQERPSIAVLPFVNMSGDPEQEYFSDGITEDIITDLSKVSGLFVVARNTAFTYKGKHVDVQEVAKRLGVNFILEGSVRKAGARVRVTGQLINGKDGGHVWADRYDRDLTDIFAIQDEITHAIVEQLKVKLLPQEKKSIGQTPTDNVEAYTFYLRGRQFMQRHSKSNYQLAAPDVRQGGRVGSALCTSLRWHRRLRFFPLPPLPSWRRDRQLFWPQARRRWLWTTSSPKRMLREGSHSHLSNDMRKRRRNSKRQSRWIQIPSRDITFMPVPASRRGSWSGRPRFLSGRQKTSRTIINHCAC